MIEDAGALPRRVLMAKVGLDGHDRGVKIVARMLRDAGYEVIYAGLRSDPQMIAATAAQEDVDLIGLSILSGGHLGLVKAVIDALRGVDREDIPVVVGGTIPERDVPALLGAGAAAVMGVGSHLESIQQTVQRVLESASCP